MAFDHRPSLGREDVELILREEYGLDTTDVRSVRPLVSYADQTFHIALKHDGHELLLKVINWQSSQNTALHDEQNELMVFLSSHVPCPVPLTTLRGELMTTFSYDDMSHRRTCIVRLFNFLPGRTPLESGNLTKQQASEWGSLLGRTHVALREVRGRFLTLLNFNTEWAWNNVSYIRRYLHVVSSEDDRALIEKVLGIYDAEVLPKLLRLDREVCHGDLNENNILVNSANEMYAVLDLGEVQGGPFIWDVTLMLAYMSLVVPDGEDIIDYFSYALKGYASHMPHILAECSDVEIIRILTCARLCQSVTCGLYGYLKTKDPYVASSQRRGWPILRSLLAIDRERMTREWSDILGGSNKCCSNSSSVTVHA